MTNQEAISELKYLREGLRKESVRAVIEARGTPNPEREMRYLNISANYDRTASALLMAMHALEETDK